MGSLNSLKSGGMIIFTIFAAVMLISSQAGKKNELPIYFSADSAYHARDYQKALSAFTQLEKKEPHFFNQNPTFYFKFGYTLLRMGEWEKSLQNFEMAAQHYPDFGDYAHYFSTLALQALSRDDDAIIMVKKLRREFDNSSLISLTDSLLAKYYENQNVADSMVFYYKKMLKWGRFDKSSIYAKLMYHYFNSGQTENFRKQAFQFIKLYPFHVDADKIYPKLERSYSGKIPKKNFKALLNFLFRNHSFITAGKLVDQQKRYATTKHEKEYFEWLPVDILYREAEYKKALDWCLNNRNRFTSFEVIQNIDLMLPRCYLRLGEDDKSIKAYLDYYQKYPGHSLANEILWKVGWLYEDKKEYIQANQIYTRLINKRGRDQSFKEEAGFRIGLNYFRLHKYESALNAFNNLLKRTTALEMQARVTFWLAKIYQLQGKMDFYWPLMFRLAERPVDSYYNTKAFFVVDAHANTGKDFRKIFWELHQNNESHISTYLEKYSRVLVVEDLLGKSWSDRELSFLKSNRSDWKEVFALGELYQRLNDPGKAYRNFRSIYVTWYQDSNLDEMIPVFKKLYPFYFLTEIESEQGDHPVETEFVLSVMKKESAFEPEIVSYANAYGLMQIIPPTASQIAPKVNMRFTNPKQLYDPEVNIKMGMYYLHDLLQRYNSNKYMALAAYNAGPHRVDRWIEDLKDPDIDFFVEDIEFDQTRRYVRTCMKYYWTYKLITEPNYLPSFLEN